MYINKKTIGRSPLAAYFMRDAKPFVIQNNKPVIGLFFTIVCVAKINNQVA